MGINILKITKEITKLKHYTISKKLFDLGVSVTVQGLDVYAKPGVSRMKLNVLCGLRRLSGLSWSEWGKILDEQFLPKK